MVMESFLNQGFFVVALQEVQTSHRKIQLKFNRGHVSTRDLVVFTRQLSTMLTAGLSILMSFSILSQQTTNKTLKKSVLDIKADIESGTALWESMAKHRNIFSPVYISMIRAGELGGVLDNVLDRLGEHLEREHEISSKIKSASVYPAMVSVFAVSVIIFILAFIMPTFTSLFQSSGVELPWTTRTLLGLGLIMKNYMLYLGLLLVLIIYLLKSWGKKEKGRLFYDRMYLRIPLLGKTLSRIIVARFTRTMGTLVRSGIPILQALEVVEDVVGNAVVAQAIHKARGSISDGESITRPLEATEVFEPMVTQMISVGEETGSLDLMLAKMSDYYEKEVMHMIDAMMSLIEPLLILVVGLLVGGIVVATMLPIFDMIQLVG